MLLMLHGGGHSALSWAAFAREICARCAVRAVAFDQRGHGSSMVDNEEGMPVR
jgi:protein phosphatase methylesterase 1